MRVKSSKKDEEKVTYILTPMFHWILNEERKKGMRANSDKKHERKKMTDHLTPIFHCILNEEERMAERKKERGWSE